MIHQNRMSKIQQLIMQTHARATLVHSLQLAVAELSDREAQAEHQQGNVDFDERTSEGFLRNIGAE